ncbi:DUF1835 domain-containing protein [Aliikangiella coralliicola]|uniref:DUF1835 domain-containing protein n=1 Tax=Aliikangiella coralliicola TaxID=2592383 RepID=A0A545UIL1_9GAMM|nr:DUF1835 domain-containing protein [Aliikangiella coralliicola]TQV89295.1 DUF1835 domain-containing protein [Aliikangiella coralliicola]
MKTLHITNGSNTTDLMEAANIVGDKLSWDDLLHEGPVISGLSLEELSDIRADYIAEMSGESKQSIREKFDKRNSTLNQLNNYEQVTLWFEHDLYDQLQLLQLLDWFKHQNPRNTTLDLINTDKYLGYHTPEEFAQLTKYQTPVSDKQLVLAASAWEAFTANEPAQLSQLLSQDLSPLPFLRAALVRLCREFPDEHSGLPMTEKLILDVLQENRPLENGPLAPGKLFQQYQSHEEAQFMGDSPFWWRLNQMTFCKYPLLVYTVNEPISFPLNPIQKISISPYGEQVLAGKANWFTDNALSRFIGGCQLTKDNRWRWSKTNGNLIKK